MSGCDPLRVHALHDGTLGALGREEAARHVAQCAGCTDALAQLRALDALAREAADVPAGYFEALPARIAARAKGPARARAAWSRPATWASALAAVLLIAVVTPRLLNRSRPESERLEPKLAAPAATRSTTAPRQQAATPPAVVTDLRPAPNVGDVARPPVPMAPPAAAGSSAKREAKDVAPATHDARRDEATTAPEPLAERERRAAPAPAAPAVAFERAAPAISEPEGRVAPAAEAAGAVPQVMQKSSAAPRTAGFAAAGPPAPDLTQARAEREERVREAQRPGAYAAARRRAFEAAAAVVRLGGDDADRAALREQARLYLAIVSDPAERQRVQATLQESDPH